MIFNMVGGGGSNPFAMVLVNYPQNSTLTATNVDGFKDIFPSSSANPQRLYYVSQPSGETQTCVFSITDSTHIVPTSYTISGITVGSARTITLSYIVPPEYQAVEYLQSSGTQYIIPNIDISNITKLQIKHSFTGTICYAYGNSLGGSKYFQPLYRYSSAVYSACFNNYTAVSYSGDDVEYEINITDSAYSITGDITINGTFGSKTSTSTILFGRKESSSTRNLSSVKIYYINIYESNILTREFVPCYRRSDNVAGLWDRVSETFFENSGSGTFVVGGDI